MDMFLLLITGLSLIDALSAASCGQTSFTSSSGTVTSPDYYSTSSYASGLYCTYDINVTSGYGVWLAWTTFDVKGDMPNCLDDYVEIFIGCGRNSIGRYCSENSYKPFDVFSPDKCLRLVFKSDSSGSGQGFSAYYNRFSMNSAAPSLSLGGCYGTTTLYSDSGVISSVDWPRWDSERRDCYWRIDVESYAGIKIAFMDLDLEYDFGCENDKVKVKGGSSDQSYDSSITVQSSMCGARSPFSFTSRNDQIWIRFKSNGYYNDRGFVAGYVLYHYGVQNATSVGGSSTSGSSTSALVGIVVGIVVAVVIFALVGSIIYFVFVYRRRQLARQQASQNQAMTTQVNVSTQQSAMHHPPPPPQAGYGPPPGAGYGPPPPVGYAPPSQGYAPPSDNAPLLPYHQVVAAPYPQHGTSGPYPSATQGGAPPYPPGKPGEVTASAPYPAGPYPPPPPGDAPYPQQ